ncbi:MAG: 1-deoxy-D-xylulose-5-phosphate reductoisomerase [OCS116 cluster bacterium]|uniref:1-deoxy-D-xylulose 5-phosphate reductoisomerase n=1 Tax=OCS116 cluster bacterium TaxID=2030921 RepID=A0A2A4Z3U0_9PROT|nr:1-deoxy-D-xylulose-5-phosphate reductoisomerase [OCS116 cluster bacterium]
MKTINIFGVTGSIGLSTVKVLKQHPDKFSINAVTGGNNVKLLAQLAIELNAKYAVIANASKVDELKSLLDGHNIKVDCGEDGLIRVATHEVDICMAAIVGYAGLKPTLTSLKYAKRVALANKECLVAAGELFLATKQKYGCELTPVDSEHSAMFQCLQGSKTSEMEKILLTASGGPFRTHTLAQMQNITKAQALNHPNWDMGAKITIDSATLMNKGNELIEAYHLFPIEADQIEVVVHKQSIIHSLIQYHDGSVIAQLGTPEMGTAISYALGWPDRLELNFERLDLFKIARLDFEPADEQRFKCLYLAKQSLVMGGTCGAVLNAANEVAVKAFLAEEISFLAIADICEETINLAQSRDIIINADNLDDVCEVDKQARLIAQSLL